MRNTHINSSCVILQIYRTVLSAWAEVWPRNRVNIAGRRFFVQFVIVIVARQIRCWTKHLRTAMSSYILTCRLFEINTFSHVVLLQLSWIQPWFINIYFGSKCIPGKSLDREQVKICFFLIIDQLLNDRFSFSTAHKSNIGAECKTTSRRTIIIPLTYYLDRLVAPGAGENVHRIPIISLNTILSFLSAVWKNWFNSIQSLYKHIYDSLWVYVCHFAEYEKR